MRALKRFELVELVIPANSTGTKFQYPDIPQLRDDPTQDIIIRSLRTYIEESMPFSPQGNPVATSAQVTNSFLVLYVENEESVHQIPLGQLNTLFGTGGPVQFEETEMQDLKVDWNKSYIQMAVAPTPSGGPANTQFSIMLGVGYKKLPPGTWEALTKGAIKGM